MNGQAINALGYLMSQIRPDWDAPGCVAALRKLDDMPLHQVLIAAARYSADETNLTPGNLPNFSNRAWDTDWHLPCKVHPNTRARRTDGECAACYVDRKAITEPAPLNRQGTPPNEATRKQLLAAIHGGTA